MWATHDAENGLGAEWKGRRLLKRLLNLALVTANREAMEHMLRLRNGE
jgi:hypothetical protein